MDEKLYDVVIIGGGPAGYTSAIYSSRALLNVLVIESYILLSQLSLTDAIENYPGYKDGINGLELLTNVKDQAEKFGAKIIQANVSSVLEEKNKSNTKTIFEIHTDDNQIFKGKSVIIATGAKARKLGVPGEQEYTAKGVSYCAICDGPFFRNKHVAVVGGGDTAIQEALFLSKFAAKVTVIHRRDKLRAQKILQQKAFNNEKINFIWNSKIEQIIGENSVKKLNIKNIETNQKKYLDIDGLFIFIGFTPNTQYIADLVQSNAEGYIETDEYMHTDVKGVFAAGDVRANTYRQIAIAVGDGAKAALSCEKYLEHELI
ncbi:MAG: thioredoxin-disulfide reductase [Spirochaetes bacterium]|nr:thioredoxin-disulfide reductase [Spirochaetota bacterium]